MSQIANYTLGSVQGEVRITYDGKGIKQADKDVSEFTGKLGTASDQTDQFTDSTDKATESVRKLGKESKFTISDAAILGKTLGNLSKIPILVGAAAEVAGLGGAIVPVIGLAAALPAVLGTVASMAAVVKIGVSGMGDAMKAAAEGDAKALEEALKKLSPEAQKVVRAFAAMQPQLDGLKLDVQDRLMRGLGETLTQLGNAYLPTVATGFGRIADEMNRSAKLSATALMTPTVVNNLGLALENTARTTHNLGGALGDVLAGAINMAGVGSHWIPRWTEGAEHAARSFREWTESARGQQQINAWISMGADALGKIYQILVNLGGIVKNVFSAMEQGSGSILQNFIALTDRMLAWTASAEGQQFLVALFTLLHQIFLATADAIALIIQVLTPVLVAFGALPEPVQSVIASFIVWIGLIGILISKIAPLIGWIIKYWTEIAKVGSMMAKFGGWIGTAIMWIVRLAGTLLANAARMAAAWLIAMGPIGWVILAVAALVALIIVYWDEVKAFTIMAWTAIVDWLVMAWNTIVLQATTIWNAIVGFFVTIWDSIVAVWTAIWAVIGGTVTTIWNGIIAFLMGAWTIIKNIFIFFIAIILAIFSTFWNPIWELTVFIWTAIVAFLTTVWTGIVTLATTIWNMIVSIITTVWNAIVAFLTPILAAIGAAISATWNAIVSVTTTVWNGVVGAITAAWNAVYSVVSSVLGTIWSFISSIFNQISSFISGVWNSIVSITSSLWNSIYNAIKGPIDRAWQTVMDFGNRIKGIAGEAINWLVSAGRNIVTGLWNGIAAMGGWLYGQIMGWIRSVVPGPILQFLGIASPSKWARDEVGKQIPAGLAGGMHDDTGVATRAATKMASDVADATRRAAMKEAATMGIISRVTSAVPLRVNTAGLTGEASQRVQALMGSVGGSSGGATPSAAAAQAASTGATSTKTITIGNVTVAVQGNLDPTDPVKWRAAMEEIREGLTDVEASYR